MRDLTKDRLKAFILDVAILIVIEISVVILLTIFVNRDFLYIYSFATSIVFCTFFCKDIINGQSAGKRILKLQVVTEKGGLPSLQNLILRNIVALLQPIDVLYITINDKRLGDMLCKTKVVSTINRRIENKYPLVQILMCIVIVFFITSFIFLGMCLIADIVNS